MGLVPHSVPSNHMSHALLEMFFLAAKKKSYMGTLCCWWPEWQLRLFYPHTCTHVYKHSRDSYGTVCVIYMFFLLWKRSHTWGRCVDVTTTRRLNEASLRKRHRSGIAGKVHFRFLPKIKMRIKFALLVFLFNMGYSYIMWLPVFLWYWINFVMIQWDK